MITAHTDVVGSLLRPPELLKAREDLGSGRITPAVFKAIEDRAVDEAIALQEEAGLEVVTDGEMRRLSPRRRSRWTDRRIIPPDPPDQPAHSGAGRRV